MEDYVALLLELVSRVILVQNHCLFHFMICIHNPIHYHHHNSSLMLNLTVIGMTMK